MKIGLNATCLNDRASGAKQRFVGIYGELFRLLENDEFVIYQPADCEMGRWFGKSANVTYRRTPLSSRRRAQRYLRGLVYWPAALRTERHDVFEGFNLPLVKAPAGRTVVTIHDIRSLYENGLGRITYKAALERSFRIADHVITVSESMREEILDLFPLLPISVIYNGVDTTGFESIANSDLSAFRRTFDLPGEFLLAVGHFEKRKNYIKLVDALGRLHARGLSAHLVIVGNNSGEMAAVKERINSLGLSRFVKILDGLTDFEVRCIYKICSLFVFASAYEGFGIPILEAMAARRPMVLSDIPVFREITQGQGVYFRHTDPESIADNIEKVLCSNSERERLVVYGDNRVQNFSFKNISMSLARLYGLWS